MVRSLLVALVLPGSAWAGSISASGNIAGPDASPTTADPAALHYNPAAIAATEGVQALIDVQMTHIDVQVTADRNGGIDPNTGEPYNVAMADVWVPVFMVGATWKVIPDRLAIGIAATDNYAGGGDYTSSETDPPPYQSHQRYFGVDTTVLALATIGGVGVTLLDGVHIGGGAIYTYDVLTAVQSSDPLGTEGLSTLGEPYAGDAILEADTSGSHMTWNAGIFVDRFRFAKVGVSYTAGGLMETDGTGSVTMPGGLSATFEPVTEDALITTSMPLPAVIRYGVASELSEPLEVGFYGEYFLWNDCCGSQEGDLEIGVTDLDGNQLGTGDDSDFALPVSEVSYSPRRLWNSSTFNLTAAYDATDRLWVGTKIGYSQFAVPDWAVSATNLDFDSFGVMGSVRYAVAGPLTLGLAYSKFFTSDRTITNSAWNAAEDSDDYRDDRLSPVTPYKASSNGTYSSQAQSFGFRLGLSF